MWETSFDVERHPTMTATWYTGNFGLGTRQAAADSYRFGLDRLLDGIQGGPRARAGVSRRLGPG